MKRILPLLLILITSYVAKADEGMWLPMFIERLNYSDMQKKGLQLTPDEIYSINNSSLKDAIVRLNYGGCTAEMISKQGLVLTNHHCAYGAIQANSSTENDYLTDGFWAYKKSDELQAKGTVASFLVRMEDVTSEILKEVTADMTEADRSKKIREVSKTLKDKATEDNDYEASVKSFFGGNEFYLFVYKTYKDVRLVGAPPSSIGKFGGDTDNWMWPRQTGDFALLRIYADKDNNPTTFSQDNKPYTPGHSLPISLQGVKAGDYAMIMGYPGRTDRYLTSFGVDQAITIDQPARVKLRGRRLAIQKKYMDADAATRIKYASKYARVSNYYKYFKGQTRGLKRLKVIDKKQKIESDFMAWVNQSEERKNKYSEALKMIENGYQSQEDYLLVRTYFNEAILGSEILRLAFQASRMGLDTTLANKDEEKIEKAIAGFKNTIEGFYKDYDASIDQEVTAAVLEMYYQDINKKHHPEQFKKMSEKANGNFYELSANIFSKSIFDNEDKMMEFLENPSSKTLSKDPAFVLADALWKYYDEEIRSTSKAVGTNIRKGNRLLIAGLREMNPNKKYYPNANSTMRLSYGQVLDYYPADAVYYNYYTTLAGIMEKEDATNPEFVVPEKLKEIYKNKDYGRYGEGDVMKVNFITNNDITGGNSGSPVINGRGHLIGLAFDGNWEAMSGDIAFEQKLQRTISVDIRYVMLIIDKYAGAKNLIEEMNFITATSDAKAEKEPAMEDKKVLKN